MRHRIGLPPASAGLPPEPPRSPSSAELERATQVLQLIADRTRLAILVLLLQRTELSVGEIAEQLDRPLPAISQHLAKLKSGDLVHVRAAGRAKYYRLSGTHVAALVEQLLQHTEHQLFADPPHHRGSERT